MPGLVASSSLGLTSSSTSSGTGPPPRPAASGLDVDWEIIDKKRFLGFGSISVFIVRFLVYPFSLVKTRMQVGRAESQRVFATIRDISGREGLRALYAGFSVSIFGAVPAQLVYISTYELVKSRVAGMTPQGVFAGGVYDEATKAFTSNLVGGACASLASQFVVVPIDVVAQRLMIQTRSKAGAGLAAHTTLPNGSEFPPYRNGVHVLRHILATEGFVGLYRGFFSSLATYMPSSALWWATNAIARRNLNWLVYGSTGAADGRNERHPRLELANADDPRETDEESDSHPWNEYDIPDSVLSRPPADLAILASSGIAAGFVSAFLTNPLDVLKTRIQTRTGGGRTDFAGVVRELWMRDGVPGFFRGVRARMMSTVPTSTLLIFSYELVKSLSVKVPE